MKRLLSKRQKSGFQDRLLLNAGQKYCRMLQGEHSAILSTFIKLPFVTKTFVLSILSGVLHRLYCISKSRCVIKGWHCTLTNSADQDEMLKRLLVQVEFVKNYSITANSPFLMQF